MMRRLLAALLALAALAPVPAQAWGSFGHRTVAAIAWANIRPQTRARLVTLLKAAPQLGTPECAVRTLADAATWADCVRRDNDRFQFAARWHFQNEEVCQAYDPNENCRDGNCVTAQIEAKRKLLARGGAPLAEQVRALMFLAHFVGDIHQPLHMGDNHDRGGGNVFIVGGRFDSMSLHEVWDGPVAQEAIQSAPTPLVRGYSPAERTALGGGSVQDWGRESWGLARTSVYPPVLGHDPCVRGDAATGHMDAATFAAALPIARRRIVQAGLRLARALDEALGS
jgi:hypothetical protein